MRITRAGTFSALSWQREPNIRMRWYGLVYLVILALLVALSFAFYNKVFTRTIPVTLQSESLGTPLLPGAEVKLGGVAVGRVTALRNPNGRLATVDLAIDKDKVQFIPGNVEARLLPRTVVGNRYVQLVVPADPSPQRIAAGDVIAQDRTEAGLNLQKVLLDAMPLIQTVKADQLNAVVSALGTTLDGRGDELGAMIDHADEYLRQLSPHLPALYSVLGKAGDVTGVLGEATPDLERILRNAPPLVRALGDNRIALESVIRNAPGVVNSADDLLRTSGADIVRVMRVTRPTLDLVAAYSPQLTCLIEGLVPVLTRLEATTANQRINIHGTLGWPASKYVPGEEPAWVDRSSPNCRGLPNPQVPFPGVKLNDGSRGNSGATLPVNLITNPVEALFGDLSAPDVGPVLGAPGAPAGPRNTAGAPAERQLVSGIAAPVLGVPADQVPSVATLLFGPMARGTVVSIK